jgi:hypothetical protein
VLESAIHARPKMRGSRNHVRPKTFEYDKHVWFDKQQTKRTIVHSSCHERENKEKTQIIYHRRQSNHYLSTRAIQYGRWHNCASSETWDDQIWPPGSVTHAFLMAQAPSIRCGKKKKAKENLVKRWEMKSKTTITIHSKMFLILQWFPHII